MNTSGSIPRAGEVDPVVRYYRWHARLYDATRWSFLFGRQALVRDMAAFCQPRRILEVGCGTGGNLVKLHKLFPRASLCGVDISPHMLRVAGRKLRSRNVSPELLRQPYRHPLSPRNPFDLIVFSYCLSMINPGWEQALQAASRDLGADGWIAVVDFHASASARFKKWMALNHVRLEEHLLPSLEAHFQPRAVTVTPTYRGLWSYFSFIGTRQNGE